MSGLAFNGVHVPACVDLDAHIDAAQRESIGVHIDLDAFVEQVREDWQSEQLIADGGDEAVIAYWRSVETDFIARYM